jgi:hypothetical protein
MGAKVVSEKDQQKGWVEQLGFDATPYEQADAAVRASAGKDPGLGKGGLAELEAHLKWMKAHAKLLGTLATTAAAAAKTITGLAKKVTNPDDLPLVERSAAYYQAKAQAAAQQFKALQ